MSSHLFFLASIAVALAAPLFWALSNLFYHRAARPQMGAAPTSGLGLILVIALTGIACLSWALFLSPGVAALLHTDPQTLLLVASLGISGVAGNLFLRRAFLVGKLALVTPVSECCAPLAVVLGGITGARVSVLLLPGLIGIAVGVAMVAISWERRAPRVATAKSAPRAPVFAPHALAARQFGPFSYIEPGAATMSASGLHQVVLIPVVIPRDADLAQPLRMTPVPAWRRPIRLFLTPGIGDATLAAASFAWLYYAVSLVTPHLGFGLTAWSQQCGAALMVLLSLLLGWVWQRVQRRALVPRYPLALRLRAYLPIVLIGLTDTGGWALYALGTARLSVVLVASFAELTSVFTVLLAFAVQHERPTRWQWAGIALCVICLISIGVIG